MKYNYVYIIIFIIIILYLLKNIKCYEFFNIPPISIPPERYNKLNSTTIFDDLYFKSGNKYHNALDNEITLDTPPTNYITIKKGDDGINGSSITTDPPKGQCNSDKIYNISELKNTKSSKTTNQLFIDAKKLSIDNISGNISDICFKNNSDKICMNQIKDDWNNNAQLKQIYQSSNYIYDTIHSNYSKCQSDLLPLQSNMIELNKKYKTITQCDDYKNTLDDKYKNTEYYSPYNGKNALSIFLDFNPNYIHLSNVQFNDLTDKDKLENISNITFDEINNNFNSEHDKYLKYYYIGSVNTRQNLNIPNFSNLDQQDLKRYCCDDVNCSNIYKCIKYDTVYSDNSEKLLYMPDLESKTLDFSNVNREIRNIKNDCENKYNNGSEKLKLVLTGNYIKKYKTRASDGVDYCIIKHNDKTEDRCINNHQDNNIKYVYATYNNESTPEEYISSNVCAERLNNAKEKCEGNEYISLEELNNIEKKYEVLNHRDGDNKYYLLNSNVDTLDYVYDINCNSKKKINQSCFYKNSDIDTTKYLPVETNQKYSDVYDEFNSTYTGYKHTKDTNFSDINTEGKQFRYDSTITDKHFKAKNFTNQLVYNGDINNVHFNITDNKLELNIDKHNDIEIKEVKQDKLDNYFSNDINKYQKFDFSNDTNNHHFKKFLINYLNTSNLDDNLRKYLQYQNNCTDNTHCPFEKECVDRKCKYKYKCTCVNGQPTTECKNNGNNCASCNTGFYLSGNNCKKCEGCSISGQYRDGCGEKSEGICKYCGENQYLDNGFCKQHTAIYSCPSGQKLTLGTKVSNAYCSNCGPCAVGQERKGCRTANAGYCKNCVVIERGKNAIHHDNRSTCTNNCKVEFRDGRLSQNDWIVVGKEQGSKASVYIQRKNGSISSWKANFSGTEIGFESGNNIYFWQFAPISGNWKWNLFLNPLNYQDSSSKNNPKCKKCPIGEETNRGFLKFPYQKYSKGHECIDGLKNNTDHLYNGI
jgi:hypothetical protein